MDSREFQGYAVDFDRPKMVVAAMIEDTFPGVETVPCLEGLGVAVIVYDEGDLIGRQIAVVMPYLPNTVMIQLGIHDEWEDGVDLVTMIDRIGSRL